MIYTKLKKIVNLNYLSCIIVNKRAKNNINKK
jgi:hypothetical protein